MRHGGKVAGDVQGDPPRSVRGGLFEARWFGGGGRFAVLAFAVVVVLFGRLLLLLLLLKVGVGPQSLRGFRYPLHGLRIGDDVLEGLGIVQDVVGKGHRKLGELLLDLVEALLFGALQTDSPQLHSHQGVFDGPAFLLGDEGIIIGIGIAVPLRLDGFQGVVERLALREPRHGFHHPRLVGLVGLPQFVSVLDAVQVPGDPPDVSQRKLHALDDGDHVLVVDAVGGVVRPGELVLELRKVPLEPFQELLHRGAQESRFQALEPRKTVLLQKGVGVRVRRGGVRVSGRSGRRIDGNHSQRLRGGGSGGGRAALWRLKKGARSGKGSCARGFHHPRREEHHHHHSDFYRTSSSTPYLRYPA
mmetsp:Transcript_1458/g.3654  ORF Transcript_1458/g.3654 Transcript_1458/m.3654 type:complete len:359 (-) Transcript_1458:54-1130(-)